MQAELDEIKEGLYLANTEHKDIVQKMEHKVNNDYQNIYGNRFNMLTILSLL